MGKAHVIGAKKGRLTRAIKRGESVTEWARKNGVPERTALAWARDYKLRETVESVRKEALDQLIDLMASHAKARAEGIPLPGAKRCDPDAFRLMARRAVLAGEMCLERYFLFEHRIKEIEKQIEARKGQQSHAEREGAGECKARET
jgi:hypothetical protein